MIKGYIVQRCTIFTEAETIDPHNNRNESQKLLYYMKVLLMSSGCTG